MMVIVEGPDGSGKTTLCKQLCEDLELEYKRHETLQHKGPGDPVALEHWWYMNITEGVEGVYDRCFYISELIYQLATPNRPLMVSENEMMSGIHDLWVADPVLIFCLPSWQVAEPVVQSQGGPEGIDMLGFEKIHWAYSSIFAMYREMFDHVHIYDYTKPNSYEVLRAKLA